MNVVQYGLVGNDNGLNIFIHDLSCHVPHHTQNIHYKTILREHIFSRAPKYLSCIARSVSVKHVDAQNNWLFDLGVKDEIDVPFFVIVVLQSRNRIVAAAEDKIVFLRPQVLNEQRNNVTERYPETVIIIKYAKQLLSSLGRACFMFWTFIKR